jgi:hypothetical protein
MKNQSIIKVNLIRPDDVTSLRGKGEVLHTGLLALNERNHRSRAAQVNTGSRGHHGVFEDGMVGRWRELSWETSAGTVTRRGVRASIVAVKRVNPRGAKGGRKMDAQ